MISLKNTKDMCVCDQWVFHIVRIASQHAAGGKSEISNRKYSIHGAHVIGLQDNYGQLYLESPMI